MRSSLLLILTVFIFSASTFATQPKDDKKKTDEELRSEITPIYTEGIAYSLPRTGLIVNVKVQKTSFLAGPYAPFAQKYLGLSNVNTNNEDSWNLIGISIESYTEADPASYFKANDTIASQISLQSNGIISAIHAKENGTSSELLIGSDYFTSNEAQTDDFTDLSSDDFYDIIVNPETGEENTLYKSLEDKAREAADYLIRLRKKRAYTILNPSDVIPEDGLGYEVFVKEAKRLEKEYISLFKGKTSQSKHKFSFIFVPDENDVKNEILFRFSDEKGLLPKTDISGKPILLELIKDKDAYRTAIQLKKSENPNAGESGIYYRIPVSADISISDGLNKLYKGRVLLPQFGIVAPVPENFLNGNYSIRFNTETGTLKEVKEL